MNDHLLPGIERGVGVNVPMAASVTAPDGSHSAEQLGGRNWRIVVEKAVTAGDESRIIVAARAGHHPVREQASLARVKYNFPWRNFG